MLDERHQQKYKTKYGIVTTDVGLAIQFEERNFKNMDMLLSNIKLQYIQKRMEHLQNILFKVQNSGSGDQSSLFEVLQHIERSTQFFSKQFRDINNHALQGTKNHVITHMQGTQAMSQLQEFLGLSVFQCFDLITLMTVFAQILLEKQLIFVSERRDLISKVMFSFRDLLLGETDMQWHCFFITCLPTVLVDNLNAPFPTMIGVMKNLFDANVEEICRLHMANKGTVFATQSPVIVDIDSGKVMEIEKYQALMDLNHLMQIQQENSANRMQALQAQEQLQ